MAEVAARGDFFLRDDGVDLLRFFQHLRGEDVRDVVLADDHFHVNAEIVFIAENFGDASARALRGGRPLGDFYFDDDVFQVVPGLALGFFAEDAVGRLAGAGMFGGIGGFADRGESRAQAGVPAATMGSRSQARALRFTSRYRGRLRMGRLLHLPLWDTPCPAG